jgi:hypothetical protein
VPVWRFRESRGLSIPSEYRKEQCMANIGVGERFSAFILPDEQGQPVDLRGELAEAPLMLVFYRGDW